MTEQGTAYDIPQPECRTIARYGGDAPMAQAPVSGSGGAIIGG